MPSRKGRNDSEECADINEFFKSGSEESEYSEDELSEVEDSSGSGTGESEHLEDEGFVSTCDDGGSNDNDDHEVPDENIYSHATVDESDSSEDEVAPRNTVGDVPLEWYKDEEHIGYDIAGKKIKKKAKQDKLDSLLAKADASKHSRTIYDEYNDEEVELTKDEVKIVRRMIRGEAPHADFDPYAPYVDWFDWDGAKHPLSNAPEPKRRFVPSKWESKKVVRLVRAIREGRIKFDKPEAKPKVYHLWGDDSGSAEKSRHGLSYIPPPKIKLPWHEESFNPPPEFIPTQEEINSYQLMYEEDRPKYIPQGFSSLRSVPAYQNLPKEVLERCYDLYLCPRARKKRINIDPESLKPKLPSRKDLKPYPQTCYLEYRGHRGAVLSISAEVSGQWVASGSSDGTVRVWEVETGRCLRVWETGEAVQHVAWNPLPDLPVLAAAVGQDVLIINTGFGNDEQQKKIEELLHIEKPTTSDESGNKSSFLTWMQDDKHGGIRLKHFKTVSSVEWHRRGDFFTTLIPSGDSRAVLIHRLTKKLSKNIPGKLHGRPTSSVFHPSRSFLFVSTQRSVLVYDLLKEKIIKKREIGLREVSSIAIHPAGDNVIFGSKEGKLAWLDLDLSSGPYKILKCHSKDINGVAFHRSYPLFVSCSDDCTAYVFHGMVYSDLNSDPLIVPLEILRGHASTNGRGVLDCTFHPRQPWLFTGGADSVLRLYCN